MSQKKKSKKKRKSKNVRVIVTMIVILLILFIILWEVIDSKKGNGPGKEAEKVEFPYKIDDGNLEVVSLFQASIVNPDCNDEMGEDIASIEVKNESGQFLASASITVILDDDTELRFEIVDVPVDGTIWAFETSNTEISEQPVCKTVKCDAIYEEKASMMEDELSIEADGTTVTIRNLMDKSLTNLNVGFHCLFDEDVYYGGRTYTYPIDEIPAGTTIGLEVEECYLGKAQAVRISPRTEKEE